MIKRDGVAIGPPKVNERVAAVTIADLIPLEGSVIRQTLEEYEAKLRTDTPMERPKVVDTSAGKLVTDGNHRVFAAKREARTQVEVRIVDPGANRPYYESEAARSKARGRQGFESIVIVENTATRAALIVAEHANNNSDDLFANLNVMKGSTDT